MTMQAMVDEFMKSDLVGVCTKYYRNKTKQYEFILIDATSSVTQSYWFAYPVHANWSETDRLQRDFIKTTLKDFEAKVKKQEDENMNEVVKSFMIKHGIEWDIERLDLLLGGPSNLAKVSMSVRDVDFKNVNTKTIENLAVAMVDVLKGSGGGVYSTEIKNVIFNDPATIVFWTDGTKTVVKAKNEPFDPEKGLAMAMSKKFLGNQGNYFNEFKKWLPEEEEKKTTVKEFCVDITADVAPVIYGTIDEISAKFKTVEKKVEVNKTCINCKNVKPFNNPICDKCTSADKFEAKEEKDD